MQNNPEEDVDEWQDNETKQSSQSNIFLGKSNDDDDDKTIMNQDNSHTAGGHHYLRRYKSSRSSSSSMLSSVDPTPLLDGPIPGSMDDPATMSKTSQCGGEEEDEDFAMLSQFIHLLRTHHKPPLNMVEMEGDGNCLFRAISLQVYGDATMHMEVRGHCLDFMEREAAHFRDFVADEEFHEYIDRKRTEGVHGNHTEIQAMSELYNRSILVFVPNHGIEPINIFHSEYKGVDAPIRLCYMDGNHYNAVIDPLLPTAGLGLGLPGLQPGLADKLQLEEAKKISDESAMEEKMRLALEESSRANKAREEIEMKEALRKSYELVNNAAAMSTTATTVDSDDDVYKKKAMYLSEMEAADFDLEQAVSENIRFAVLLFWSCVIYLIQTWFLGLNCNFLSHSENHEQVLASSLESYRQAEQERKPPSSRRGEGRRSRFNTSPRSQRSSNSVSR